MHGIDEKTSYDPRNAARPRGSAWATYKRLLGYVWHYKLRLCVSLLFALVVAFSFGTVIFSVGGVVSVVLDKNEGKIKQQVDDAAAKLLQKASSIRKHVGWAPQGAGDRFRAFVERKRLQTQALIDTMRLHKMQALMSLSAVVIALSIITGLARYTQEFFAASIAARVTIKLGEEMYENLITMPLRFFEERTTGEVVARLTNDVFMTGRGLTNVFMKLFREPFKAVVLLSLALSIDPVLTFTGLCVLPPVAFVLIHIGRKVRKRVRGSLEKIASLVTVAKESFNGISIVKGFCMEDYETGRMKAEYAKLQRYMLKLVKADAAVEPITEVVLTIGIVIFILLSGQKVEDGLLDAGQLVILYGSLAGLLDPVRKLASVNNSIQTSVASAERVFDFIDMQSDIVEAPDAVDIAPLREKLRFEGVHFSYDGTTEVLHDINLDIRKGEMVALVGFSGAGKSTAIKLVPRFYDVTQGVISIDGVDIRRATFTSLRTQIGIVTQDTILFNDTVHGNIAAGNPAYSAERVRQAARAAHAEEFIEKLPQGYDTPIGEAGAGLSGGQKQRLAIARALVKDPAILILDEATSSLDSESEQAIQRAIEQLVVGRTTLVIAHRLSTVRRADRIVVLHEGRIVEQGTHEELLQKGGLYRRLHDVQFASEAERPV